MNKSKLVSVMMVLGLLATAARAQVFEISGPLRLALVGQVQAEETAVSTPGGGYTYLVSGTTSNLTINTKSFLKLIAADEGFTLPPNARLWLDGDMFYILRQDNTVFTNIDYGILSISYTRNVLAYKTLQTTNQYQSTVKGTLIATIDYHGSSISFTLVCYGKNTFLNKSDFVHGTAVNSFSGRVFGYGNSGYQDMILKGSLGGRQTQRYVVGNPGPPPSPLLGNQ